MTDDLKERILEELPYLFKDGMIQVEATRPRRIVITTSKERLRDVAEFLRDNYEYDTVTSVSAVDFPEQKQFVVVYHLSSAFSDTYKPVIITLKVEVDRQSPTLPSLVSIWSSAGFHERETWELFGIIFEGHPDLSRFLLPEEWSNGFPLRKDFELDEE